MAGEGPAQRQALDQAEKNSVEEVVHVGANGKPLTMIGVAAAELVPTKQYGNVTVGPVSVKRWVEDDGDDEKLLVMIHATQSLCERAVAEDRETVHKMIRQSEQGRAI